MVSFQEKTGMTVNNMKKYDLCQTIRSMVAAVALICCISVSAFAGDLADIRQRGVLRHLGVSYANFVRQTNEGVTGLDVELLQLFAHHLGVRYESVPTTWSRVFGDLTGKQVRQQGDRIIVEGETPIRGDLIANGLTILPWREKLVSFSTPTFPTGVWLIARADSPMKPIEPSGNIDTDIKETRALLKDRRVLTMKGTCLDPDLYDLNTTGADILFYTASENLDEIAPAILQGIAEATLLDIPDALIALQKWSGDIKVIGPISPHQVMGVAVGKNSPELLNEFNKFFQILWQDGTYKELVRKYYPTVFLYLGDFFENVETSR